MKIRALYLLIWIMSLIQCFGQGANKRPPVIDMHVHVYSVKSYKGGTELKLKDTTLLSPKNNADHIKRVLEQMKKYNIVISYASGDFESLDSLNKLYPGRFFPSCEIGSSQIINNNFINRLNTKILNGEVKGIGEVICALSGIQPNDPVMDTLYRIAEVNDLPIGIHLGLYPSIRNPKVRLEQSNPLLLQDALRKFPKLRMNVMHAGMTLYPDELLAMFMYFPNLYADISPLTWYNDLVKESLKDFLIKAIRYGFGDRIMFGSDEMTWPDSIGLAIDYINNADFLTEIQKHDILYNNAARYLRLSEDQIREHHN